jgi:cholesterol transport system auxiliary component
MPSRRQLFLLPLLLLTASCALLETSAPDRIFALTPLPAGTPVAASGLKIVVSEPSALRVLDTARIANRASDLEFQYYSGAVWEDRAPAILQHLLIESLRNRLGAQATSDEFASSGVPLTSELQDFQIEPGNVIHITLVVTFSGATKTFETRQTAASDRMVDLVTAFDQGCHDILTEIVSWIAGAPAVPPAG